jgi:hypothetical protein
MTALPIEPFWGRKGDDCDEFLSVIEMKAKFEVPEEADRNNYMCLVCSMNCRGEAKKFTKELDSGTKKSWTLLKAAMVEHYPPDDHEEQKEDALKDMMGLKQDGKSLEAYFLKVRSVKRWLDKTQEPMLITFMIKGLDSHTIKLLTNAAVRTTTPKMSFDKVCKYIKSCTEMDDEEKKKDDSDEEFDLTDLPPQDQILAKYFKAQTERVKSEGVNSDLTQKVLGELVTSLKNFSFGNRASGQRGFPRPNALPGNGNLSTVGNSGTVLGAATVNSAMAFNLTCFRCGVDGHVSRDCPTRNPDRLHEALPWEEQERLRQNFENARLERANQRQRAAGQQPQTRPNAVAEGNLIQTYEDNLELAEALYNASLDDTWSMADKDMRINSKITALNNIDVIRSWDEMLNCTGSILDTDAVGDKRSAEEAFGDKDSSHKGKARMISRETLDDPNIVMSDSPTTPTTAQPASASPPAPNPQAAPFVPT